MPDELPSGQAFLRTCIDYLKGYEARIKTGLASLEALRTTAAKIDPGDLEAMARAIMERTVNPHVGRQAVSATRPAEEVDVEHQPVPEPRTPTMKDKAGYLEVVSYLMKAGNNWATGASLCVYAHLSLADLATILRVTHADKFEKSHSPSGRSRWRLKPEVFASLTESPAPSAETPRASGASPEATISMSLFSPRNPAMTQTDAAAYVLKNTGAAMSTNEIVDRIVRLNLYPVEGDLKQFVNSIFSAMRRKPETFLKIGRGMWGLVEWGQNGGGGGRK